MYKDNNDNDDDDEGNDNDFFDIDNEFILIMLLNIVQTVTVPNTNNTIPQFSTKKQ